MKWINMIIPMAAFYVCLAGCSDSNVAGYALIDNNATPNRVVGYWENWNNVIWWDNNKPGNCRAGCIDNSFETMIQPYTHVIYSFLLLQHDAVDKQSYNQIDCSSGSDCPEWDGNAIYLNDIPVVGTGSNKKSTDQITSAKLTLQDFVKRTHDKDKKAILAIGGWSDWNRIGGSNKAVAIATLLAQLVTDTGADGIELDFEHLSEFAEIDNSEFDNFALLITTLKEKLDPSKTISYATRFNAFGVTRDNPIPYANPLTLPNGAPVPTSGWDAIEQKSPFVGLPHDRATCKTAKDGTNRTTCNFASDNEGSYLWPKIKDSIDMVNIMAYDGGNFLFDYKNIFTSFNDGGVDVSKINMGFEPGNQAAGGVWQGCDADQAVIQYLVSQGSSIMFWAINGNVTTQKMNAKYAPILAAGKPCV